MDRSRYSTCMTPYMTGTGKTREQRQSDMCVGAKICSGKAATREEAEQICASMPAKEPKPRKTKKTGRNIIAPDMLACIAANLDIENLTVANLPPRLEVAATHCSLGKPSTKPLTYKRFMSSCIKASGVSEDFIHSQREIKACQAKWNEMRGA